MTRTGKDNQRELSIKSNRTKLRSERNTSRICEEDKNTVYNYSDINSAANKSKNHRTSPIGNI